MVHSAICVIFPTIISMIYVDIDTEYDHSLLLVSPVHFWSHQGGNAISNEHGYRCRRLVIC
jgi:hypothetical protein